MGKEHVLAPEIIWHDGPYHMYVSYIRGVPDSWGGPAHIRHDTSPDLLDWTHHGALDLGSDRVIDGTLRYDRDEPVRLELTPVS